MRRRRALAIVCALALSGPAIAQSASGVAVVDQERLFEESLYGQRILSEVVRRTEDLATENRRIEAELVAEERRLTEARASTDAQSFAALAEAFDAKVKRLRAAQDAKAAMVARLRDESRAEFFRRVGPILVDLLSERGSSVLLDRRAVLVSADGADITGAAIARIDAAIGDGAARP